MVTILIRVSEPYSRPSLIQGEYVDVSLCEQIDFCGREITETTPFYPVHTFGPLCVSNLRAYLFGLQAMARTLSPEDQFTVEVPLKLHPQLLGVDNLRDAITEIAA